MKTMLALLLTLSLSAALLTGCTASAQSAADVDTGPVCAASMQQTETVPVAQVVSAVVADRDLCTDTDCDGGKHCNNEEEWAENRNCSTPCKNCGEDTCDGGANCSGRNSHLKNHHGGHHGNHHHHHNE